MKIPLIRPSYGDEEIKSTTDYLKSGGFLTEYKLTEKFEKKLAKFLGVKYVSLVTSGTSALYLSLLASGLPKNSKIAVPDLTMVATYNVVIAAGMEPILVDVYENGCMDLEKMPKGIKGLIYVDLNGKSGDMDKISQFCLQNKIVFIEDACQALGSKYHQKFLGTFGRFGCFSLGFHKIITTGQGGFVVTHNMADYKAVEKLKDFGRTEGGADIHNSFGLNFKFTDFQAVFGLAQLKTIRQRMEKKRKIYEWYINKKPKNGFVPWVIEYKTNNLEDDFQKLTYKGIRARKMYPPLHIQKFINIKKKFPVSEKLSKSTLWLPSSLDLTRKEIKKINGYLSQVN